MSTPRIGKRELVRTALPPGRRTTTGALSRTLASPLGILIVLPSIVLAMGLFLTLIGQTALKGSNTTLGQKRLRDQVKLVAIQLHGSFAQADPLLDELAEFALHHDPSKPIEPIAMIMNDLMVGRAGVAYVSVSFPDGTFQGSYLEADGSLHFQDSRIGPSGTLVKRYAYAGHDALTPIKTETTAYDPRKRGFYKLALEQGHRAWTAPYPFFKTHETGITRTQPLYEMVDAKRELHAVLTVDFDVNALSQVLSASELPNMRTLLFARDGTLLAYPQGKAKIQTLPLNAERALSYRDLGDPILTAFFTQLERPEAAGKLTSFEVGHESYVTGLADLGSEGGDLDWRVAYLVPEQVFFESLHSYSKRSIAIAAFAVLLALGVSISFARMVGRVRREAADARAAAQRANQQARELGSYRLMHCLGKGGMGEVWRAEHRLLAREAAIKLIRLDDGAPSSTEAQERFRREAQTLAALRSRNTIELFDYGVSNDGTFFYVMELLDGLDLESLVVKYGPQPPGRVVHLLMQACRSLSEAHAAGMVHRDIKPANLFTCRCADEVDVVKVLDFGLVRELSTGDEELKLSSDDVMQSLKEQELPGDSKLTRAGSVMGTPDFMAPEQALGKPLDGRADLYALGCVGYWLLTGRTVFPKPNTMQILIAHIHEVPRPLGLVATQPVPAALDKVIMACLAKSADQRPQLASELWQMLEAARRELGAEEQWSDERAQAWWSSHQPRQPSTRPTRSQAPVVSGGQRIADAEA